MIFIHDRRILTGCGRGGSGRPAARRVPRSVVGRRGGRRPRTTPLSESPQVALSFKEKCTPPDTGWIPRVTAEGMLIITRDRQIQQHQLRHTSYSAHEKAGGAPGSARRPQWRSIAGEPALHAVCPSDRVGRVRSDAGHLGPGGGQVLADLQVSLVPSDLREDGCQVPWSAGGSLVGDVACHSPLPDRVCAVAGSVVHSGLHTATAHRVTVRVIGACV